MTRHAKEQDKLKEEIRLLRAIRDEYWASIEAGHFTCQCGGNMMCKLCLALEAYDKAMG
jgi:hypothetical protein